MSQETPVNQTVQDPIEAVQNTDIARYWLAAIIESADDAIVSKTLEGIITSWNRGAERLFGYTAEEVVGKPITIIIPEDHLFEEPAILGQIRSGERIEHFDTIRVRKDGQLVDVSLTVSPIRGENGTIVGVSKIARDITERKQIEARLRQALQEAQEAKKQAEEASRLKDDFLATISHELRTPLTAMIGWIRMLRDGRLSESDTYRALEVIDRNTRSQAQLVEDLLDISRIVTGKMQLNVKPLEPSSAVMAAVDAMRPAAEAKNIRLQMIIDPNAGPVVADYERLQQVAWNLLSNAIRFTPRGGRVQVQIERVESSVKITVSDTGKGMSQEFLSRAFHRFSQADSSLTRSMGGLGLGLSIVKSIVELHGGTVHAASEGDDKGATFTVLLPVSARPASKQRDQHVEVEQRNNVKLECPVELAGLRILVVDDEPDTCVMVSTAFEQCESEVKVAASALEALQKLDEWIPDVLISDISMPEMDGLELIRRIRSREPQAGGNIPAVALTALSRIDDRVKVLSAGYQMHVAKPVELAELRAIVASLASVVIEKNSGPIETGT